MSAKVIALVGAIVFFVGGTALLSPHQAETEPTLSPTANITIVDVTPTPTTTPKQSETETPPTPQKTTPTPSAPAVKNKPATAPAQVVTPIKPAPTQAEFEATAARLRSALVNIYCLSGDPHIRSISGSGVIVDPRGIIVTNAHIAQYYLLATDPAYDVSCTIRIGSPAQAAYDARLVFVSPAWISENAKLFGTPHPVGTGEHDVALLAITGAKGNKTLPEQFSYLPLSNEDPFANEPVVVASYAAQFLTSGEIHSALYPVVVFGSVTNIYTFVKTSVDVITLLGSAAAQEGSSGGGIASGFGTLEGVITTSTIEGTTAGRTLAGITASYIHRAYETESGESYSTLLSRSPIESAARFAPQIPPLRALIAAQISN